MQAPIFIDELELTEPITDISLPERADGSAYNGVHLLVKLQHVPVGYVFLRSDSLDSGAIARLVWEQLSAEIITHYARAGRPAIDGLSADGLTAATLEDESTDCPQVSVVVCTRNRPESIL